ncbi:MAG: phosphoribosylanthranilate isomerase [Rikenellaceae bacterium]
MLIKVCGMREQQNAADVAALGVDMMGFIFFERSARFVDGVTPSTPKGIKRVGVFVNAPIDYILSAVSQHLLNFVQLHGSESVELCRELKARSIGVIKAISIATKDDIALTTQYNNEVDYFVFDTKCTGYGGSGERFDWSILEAYQGSTPFLLSGGIDPSSVDEIKTIHHKAFAGVDLNSRFEVAPALKNSEKLRDFIEKIR